jgi:hypothetical protein
MVTTTLCTADALAKANEIDLAALMSVVVMVKACVALAPEPVSTTPPKESEVVAEMLFVTEHSESTRVVSRSASAAKSMEVEFSTPPPPARTTSPLAKSGSDTTASEVSAKRDPHSTEPWRNSRLAFSLCDSCGLA